MDWGTSNFRAFRLDATGEVVERRSAAAGILSVPAGGFADVLRSNVGDWVDAGERRVLLSGMVGSRNGWVEVPYLGCPAGIAEVAAATVAVEFAGCEARLIPGVKGVDPSGTPEVMRGEETEILGMLEGLSRDALVCLPGTHTKWVRVRDGAIVSFETSMTGEVFGALKAGTILGRTITGDSAVDDAAFLRGVDRSKDDGGLLHHLFGVRSLFLMDQLKESESASYLSGLLIGHEVRSMLPTGGHVRLSGALRLSALYALAIEACGGTSFAEDELAGVRGHVAVGRRLGWL